MRYLIVGILIVALALIGTVNAAGEVRMNANVLPNISFGTVQFNGTVDEFSYPNVDYGNNNSDTWNWSFGDGNFSNEQNPLYTYTVDGSYNITLSVSNVNGTWTTENDGFVWIQGA